MDQNPIIVALDVKEVDEAARLVSELWDYVGAFKLGLEFQMAQLAHLMASPQPLYRMRRLRVLYKDIQGKAMWDGKFDDISHTVAEAVEALIPISPWGFTIQASSGRQSLAQAVAHRGTSKVIGVTVLTSLDAYECYHIYGEPPELAVVKFARDLVEAGADAVVCSPLELGMLNECGLDTLERVVPGIRSSWSAMNDQSRTLTPKEAMDLGANYLVIGRPITRPPLGMSRVDAAKRILAEIYG